MRLDLDEQEANAVLWTLRHARGWPEALDPDATNAFFSAQARVADRIEDKMAKVAT
jgi:hypothetical protein